MIRFQFFIYTLLSFAACAQVNNKKGIWKSEYRLLSFSVDSPWQQLPSLDTKDQVISGVIDVSDGTSYTIKITDDVPKTTVSDSQYYAGARKMMLDANQANRVLREFDTVFHSMPAHRTDYMMRTNRWGLMKQVNYIIRNEKEFISVQILYPFIDNKPETQIPASVLAFDKLVLLNGK
ncbi:hypothetical protein [Lacibacter sp.]|uniref:hypothetical protein n=1 Tax=Lacibacter sp. TaxID=1915409 RepID=UPI002B4B096C|nr:hypothetical protein [Lacibacter sp.]HLP39542.1 hypothetical protein [Lacibacter sp.]